ncbi:MAG: Na/Pi cotransporter family protein, partial [Luteimonas sp.]|nr:Na/Pi cotransporter family protein [Luteimonas sp.]
MVAAAAVLGWSFWRSAGWLQLCAGLAMFLFGMQCLEEGLRQLAGGRLEQMLARSTRTRGRALLFGVGGTVLLQSSTLVSLLTIAFISSGLIQLAGGIGIILGANLGATSGIWLLALAGQDLSLSPLALPLLVFGVLAGFAGPRSRAAGRVVLGVAFIFLGIDQIKAGFGEVGGGLDMAAVHGGGVSGTLLFVLAGLAVTVVLQSSHATLMLTLAALAGGRLQLEQGLAIAIGSNVGSSVTTAFVGMLGGNRSGQRLALAHALFNVVTALAALLLLVPLTWTVKVLSGLAGFGGNALLQLALFHTLFNVASLLLMLPAAGWFATRLERLFRSDEELLQR